MKTVLVLLPVEARHKEKLEAAGAGCRFVYRGVSQVTREELQSAEIILGQADPKLLEAPERLELLQLESSGADVFVRPGVLAPGTVLCSATGAYSKTVAEHGFAVTWMLLKRLHLYRDGQRKAVWQDRGPAGSLSGSTVAVIGLGEIGLYYARLAKAMGARVLGVKRRASSIPPEVDELFLSEELDRVLPRADVIFSVLPSTAESVHVYTAERFALMKDSAIFINCGRGNAVDGQVLYEALTGGRIAAAALDVTEPEPLNADSPLWGLENLVITPHVSGGYHLPDTLEMVVDIAARNLASFLRGEPLQNVIDRSTGYKAAVSAASPPEEERA